MKTLLVASVAAGALACGSPRAIPPEQSSTVGAGQAQTLTQYLNGEFEEELARKPEWATSMGRKDNYDKLDDRSELGQQSELEWRRQSVREMKARFDRSRLAADDQTSYDMWAAELDAAELRAQFRRHEYIFGYSGPHTELPKEIHAIGLREVVRLHKEMDAIRRQVHVAGDLKALFEFMRTDRQFYLANTDQARAKYLRDSENFIASMKPQLSKYFGRLPKAELVAKRVEAFREMPGGAAHYDRPTPDGKQPGIFYSHMSDMNALATWAQEAVT